MKYDGKEVVADFEEAFNQPISDLTEQQIWWMVKVIKNCRKYCRNNAAFNNYMNRNFNGHIFGNILKTNPDGTTYMGLQIMKSIV